MATLYHSPGCHPVHCLQCSSPSSLPHSAFWGGLDNNWNLLKSYNSVTWDVLSLTTVQSFFYGTFTVLAALKFAFLASITTVLSGCLKMKLHIYHITLALYPTFWLSCISNLHATARDSVTAQSNTDNSWGPCFGRYKRVWLVYAVMYCYSVSKTRLNDIP